MWYIRYAWPTDCDRRVVNNAIRLALGRHFMLPGYYRMRARHALQRLAHSVLLACLPGYKEIRQSLIVDRLRAGLPDGVECHTMAMACSSTAKLCFIDQTTGSKIFVRGEQWHTKSFRHCLRSVSSCCDAGKRTSTFEAIEHLCPHGPSGSL